VISLTVLQPKGTLTSMARMRSGAAKKELLDDVRGRVLTAAVKLIEKDGLAALSMREVARAAGVSHQAPYHYFEDRESILAAIAQEGFTVLATRLESAARASESASVRIETLGRIYVEFACEHPALFRVMFRPDFVDAERFPQMKRCSERAFDVLPTAIQACIAEGVPPEPSVQALMVLGWSMVHGLACLLLDGPLEQKLPELAKQRDTLIREVMTALRMMIEARSEQGVRPKKAVAKKARARR
jgi:AcrR family transcriptional regulator